MAVTADKVVVELEARLGRYLADVNRASAQFGNATSRMQRQIKDTEAQMRRSSEGISSAMRSMAGALAAAFSVQQVTALADTWTRFTNSLKVAGLEGQNLIAVQGQLQETANRNGIAIESVGELYGKAAQSADVLGASQKELQGFTDAVAASLRVQGTSSAQAAGAITQLGQALASPRVEMEEFGSILDGMLPLVQEMAKRVEGAGGTVAGLRALIKDKKGAGVSGAQLFEAATASAAALEERAARAQLTISASFTTLMNDLARYIGGTDDAYSATERVSQAIRALAANLDTVIPALATIATVMGVRLVAGYAAAATGAVGLTAANVRATIATRQLEAAQILQATRGGGAVSASALRAAASVSTMAVAMGTATAAARGLGASMLAMVGGPIGAAILAIGGAIYYLYQKSQEAAEGVAAADNELDALAESAGLSAANLDKAAAAAGTMTDSQRTLISKTAALTGEVHLLGNGWARVAALAKAAAIEQLRATLTKVKAIGEEQSLVYSNSRNKAPVGTSFGSALGGGFKQRTRAKGVLEPFTDVERTALGNAARANDLTARLEARIKAEEARPLASYREDGRASAPAAGGGGKPKPKPRGSGRSGPSAEEIAERYADEMASYAAQLTQATADLAGTRLARYENELAQVELERQANARQIEQNDDYSNAQKLALSQENDRVAAKRVEAIQAENAAALAADAAQLVEAGVDLEREILEAEGRNLRGTAARATHQLRLLELQRQEEEARLDAIIAARETSDVEREIARRRRASLDQIYNAREGEVLDNNRTPAQEYMKSLNKSPDELTEDFQRSAVDGLEKFNDSLADAVMGTGSLKDAFNDMARSIVRDLIRIAIQQAIIKPLAGALFGSGAAGQIGGVVQGGGGGLFGQIGGFLSALGKARTGKAIGGNVQAGQLYPVGERGVELFRAPVSGTIIPNNRLSPAGGGAGGGGVVRVEVVGSDLFDVRVQTVAGDVSATMIRAAAPTIVEGAAAETSRRLSRPHM